MSIFTYNGLIVLYKYIIMYLYLKCITYAIIEFDFQYHYNISLKQIF